MQTESILLSAKVTTAKQNLQLPTSGKVWEHSPAPVLPASLPVWASHNVCITRGFPYTRVDLRSCRLAISYFLTPKIKGEAKL